MLGYLCGKRFGSKLPEPIPPSEWLRKFWAKPPGKSLKRKNTTFRTRRKFETKKNYLHSILQVERQLPVCTMEILIWGKKYFVVTIFYASTALAGLGLLIVEASRSYSDTPHSVQLLWTSDRPVAGNSTSQHTTLTVQRHSCTRRHSNPQPQQANSRRPIP
jgi:hypothetical protein